MPFASTQQPSDNGAARTPDSSTRHSSGGEGATLPPPSPAALVRPLMAVTDEASSVEDSSELISKSPASNVAWPDASSTGCGACTISPSCERAKLCADMRPAGVDWGVGGTCEAPRRAPELHRSMGRITRHRTRRVATPAASRRWVMPARAS